MCHTQDTVFGSDCDVLKSSSQHSAYLTLNPFMPTAPTFAFRETNVSRHKGDTSGAPLKTPRDDSVNSQSTFVSERFKGGTRGAPPPLCRETSVSRTANVGTVGKNVHNIASLFQACATIRYYNNYYNIIIIIRRHALR